MMTLSDPNRPFKNKFLDSMLSLERMKLGASELIHSLTVASNQLMINYLLTRGRGQVTLFEFWDTVDIVATK